VPKYKTQKSLFFKLSYISLFISESKLIFKPVNFRTVNRQTAGETKETKKHGN
jgi:hypothetical protein